MRLLELVEAKESAEDALGIQIPQETANKILRYAIRKCRLNKKDADYLPILYENELRDHYMREAITAVSMGRTFACGGGIKA